MLVPRGLPSEGGLLYVSLVNKQTGVKTLPSPTVGNKHDQFKTALTYSTIVANYSYLDYS